ncbi:MAG: hypothetical protein AABW56_02725 [Nanoarchaeota archaeon]
MQKELILLLVFISLVLVFGFNVNAEVCRVRPSCDSSTETAVFSLYQATDSHLRMDFGGNYKVCCPSSLNIVGKFDRCGITIQNEPIILKTFSNTDSHVSAPEFATGQFTKNVCLGFNANVGSGGLTCRTQTTNCAPSELGVISIYQGEDSHVGDYNTYSNKVCCTINTCPTGFIWDGNACIPAFEVCLIQNSGGGIQPGPDCQAIWMTPVNQNDNYWDDALTPSTRDCFTINNDAACCYATEFQGNTYGEYKNVLVKKVH